MTTLNLSIFLFAYSLVAIALSVSYLLAQRRLFAGGILLLFSLIGLGISIWLGTQISQQNFIEYTITALKRLSRQETTAFLLGACCALPLSSLMLTHTATGVSRSANKSMLIGLLTAAGLIGTVTLGGLITARDILSPYLPNPTSDFKSSGIGQLTAEGFVQSTFIDTALIPVRISISPGGRIFVSGHRGIAAQEGAIVELIAKKNGDVEEFMVARMLNRPYGLFATDDALFVSRSGQYARWTDGVAEQISTGAVTLLKDLDGDGVMDYYDDVLQGLPGAKGPDYLHQNNAIAIGPDGALYATTANHTDGHPAADPLEGAILRASGSNFENIEVYANGLRNPFGLAFDHQGRLIATDNDPQSGKLKNLGDKLLVVSEGDFFGHPYALDSSDEVADPLLRSKFSLGGLTLANSPLLPPPYRNAMFVVVYGEGRIMRIDQLDDGSTTLVPFATVPGAVDIAAAPNGDFYVAVYPDKIVRIKYQGGSS